jgi:hypothetical protein
MPKPFGRGDAIVKNATRHPSALIEGIIPETFPVTLLSGFASGP